MSDSSSAVESDLLRSLVERIERIEGEQKDLADEKQGLYVEAKGKGFTVKALRAVVRRRREDRAALAEFQSILDLYEAALA